MGIEPFLLAYAINVIVAQRLIRTLCKICKQPMDSSENGDLLKFGFTEEDVATHKFYQAVGCEKCSGGYKGRAAIHEALYFTKAMCPELPDSILMGYSSKQLRWCKENEQKMWAYLVEKKVLYDFERLTLQKYVEDAPFTNTFAKESPGRTGSWIGLRIVQSFMNKNPKVTLKELMGMNNAQLILNHSGYFPD